MHWFTICSLNREYSTCNKTMGAGVDAKCGLSELLVFAAALIAGTGCSLTSKIMLDMTAVGMDGEVEKFQVCSE